jgi:hypothetical protein
LSLSQIEERILNKLDGIENRMNNTCLTLTEIKSQLCNHLKDVEKEADGKYQEKEIKFKKISVILGIVSGSSIIITLSKLFI